MFVPLVNGCFCRNRMYTTESVHSREHKVDLVYNKGETEGEWDRGEKRALTPCHQWQKDTQRFGCE